jgi:hypothetical protein
MFLGFTQNRKILTPIDQYHLDKYIDVLKFFSKKIEKTRKLILDFEKRGTYYITTNKNAYVVYRVPNNGSAYRVRYFWEW